MKKKYFIGIVIAILLTILLYYFAFNTSTNFDPKEWQNQKVSNYKENVNIASREFLQKDLQKRMIAANKLGKLYRNGIPDKYDNNGKKIKGVEPIPEKAVRYFEMAGRLGNPYALFKIAKIYHFGMHNLEPNWNNALEFYNKTIRTCSNKKVAKKAFEMAKELKQNVINRNVHNWLNLPFKNPHQSKRYQYDNASPKQKSISSTFALPNAQPVHINTIFRAQQNTNQGQRPPQQQTTTIVKDEEDLLPDHQRNDMHNVHDSGVLGTIRRSIQNLQMHTNITKPITQTLREIRDMINGYAKNDKKQDAVRALDAMERSSLPLSSTNIKEVDALHLVWNRIHDPTNKENANVLKENLVDELSECIEHSKPVCSTGRFTRILDTLNIVDPQVQIKPMYVLKNEMMDKCAKIRQQLYDALPESEKGLIDSPKENESQLHFDKVLKGKIKSELQKDYVDNNVLTQDQLTSEVSKWIDYI